MPLPMLDWAWAKKKRRAPRSLEGGAEGSHRQASALRRRRRQAAQRRAAGTVQEQEGAGHDDQVADAEDVVDRQPARGVEDVAEEAERRVGGRRGVRELGRVLRDPGGCDRVGVGGHDAAVGEDRGEVQRAAGGDDEQARDVAVDHEEGAEQQVAREVDLLIEAAAPPGRIEMIRICTTSAADGEPCTAELEIREPRTAGRRPAAPTGCRATGRRRSTYARYRRRAQAALSGPCVQGIEHPSNARSFALSCVPMSLT